MFTQICRMLIIVTLAIAPLSVFAADSSTTSAVQQGMAETEDEPACTYPAVETAGQTLQSQEISPACSAQALSETHILTEVVTITQTVLLTEVVTIEQIVPVTETVFITETVFVTETIEEIVPVTQTVLVTEVVTLEQIVPVTQTVLVTEVVTLEQIVPVTETVFVTEVVTIEQIVPVTQTVFVTEVVTVEEIVPVTQTVFVTEVVTVEEIVPITQTVLVTEVVTIEQIVPVTETVFVTEVVTVEPTVPMSETESAAPSPTASIDSGNEALDAGDSEEPNSPESLVTTPNLAGAQAQAINGQASVASQPATHWLQLSPPYSEPTPLPITGLAMYYAPQVMDRVEMYRERVNKIEACEECIGRVALLRAGDLGRLVWIQVGKGKIEGPFQVLDVAARHHIPDLLRRNWVVDVDYETAKRWGMRGPIEVTIYAEPPEKLALRTPKNEQQANP